MENYDARIANVRLNVLRRAFDSGAFSFHTPVDDDLYHELRLRFSDFQAQKKADDETIRKFIKFGAYCLAFKFAPNRPNVFVDFDCPEDLDYLGVRSDDIGRNIWFLTEKGYLRSSSAATYARPSRCSPTSKLIDEIESGNSYTPLVLHRGGEGALPFVRYPSTPIARPVYLESRGEPQSRKLPGVVAIFRQILKVLLEPCRAYVLISEQKPHLQIPCFLCAAHSSKFRIL